MTEPLTEDQRKEVFRTLVEVQDQGASVDDSRTRTAAQFSIEVAELGSIEREGIAEQWAPLSDGDESSGPDPEDATVVL